jgi:hypothetical protein
MADKMIFEKPAKPLASVTCPHCEGSYDCKEIKDLSGEAVFACPHCRFVMLQDSIKIDDRICCENCKGGFTGGAARLHAGSTTSLKSGFPETPIEGNPLAEIPIECRQETLIHDVSGTQTTNTNLNLILTWNARIPRTDDELEKELRCPFCERALKLKCADLRSKTRSQKLTARIACSGIPLLAILITYIAVVRGGVVSGWSGFLCAVFGVWATIGLFKLRVFFTPNLTHRVMLGDRVSLSEEGGEVSTALYQKTGILGVFGREKTSALTVRHIVDTKWEFANKWQFTSSPRKS